MLPESPNRPRALLAAEAGRSRESRCGACCRHSSRSPAGAESPCAAALGRARPRRPGGARNSLSGAEDPAAHRHRGHRELSAPASAPLITAAIALPAPSRLAPSAALGSPNASNAWGRGGTRRCCRQRWHCWVPHGPCQPPGTCWDRRCPQAPCSRQDLGRPSSGGCDPPGTGVPAGGTGQDGPGGRWRLGRGAHRLPAAGEAALPARARRSGSVIRSSKPVSRLLGCFNLPGWLAVRGSSPSALRVPAHGGACFASL